MWTALAVIATIALVTFWRGPNAVWGGAVLGAMGGLVAAIVTSFTRTLLGKAVVIGILVGSFAEIVGLLANRSAVT